MPGSFELRKDMGAVRLQAVEDWLRVEGYTYRFRQKRWRVWTCPDQPGEGLRPDGIDEDENPNEYPSGATINLSIPDMIEKKVQETGDQRTLQGSHSGSVSWEGEAIRRGQEAGQKMAGVPGNPWLPKPPKPRRTRPKAEPQPPAPNGLV